ncbi:hypothetical protein GGR56DRAFT_323018 [Xylariaceae sp. FL0804]|nr:hypothetical protein GGR56DRAFT_323018 [Xylariaceae sp. FL0804]
MEVWVPGASVLSTGSPKATAVADDFYYYLDVYFYILLSHRQMAWRVLKSIFFTYSSILNSSLLKLSSLLVVGMVKQHLRPSPRQLFLLTRIAQLTPVPNKKAAGRIISSPRCVAKRDRPVTTAETRKNIQLITSHGPDRRGRLPCRNPHHLVDKLSLPRLVPKRLGKSGRRGARSSRHRPPPTGPRGLLYHLVFSPSSVRSMLTPKLQRPFTT